MSEIDTAEIRKRISARDLLTWSEMETLCDEIDHLRADLDQTRYELAITELNEKSCLREIKRLEEELDKLKNNQNSSG